MPVGTTGYSSNADFQADGEEETFGGVATLFWETADANANYMALELPAGGGVDVPVFLTGIGTDGVDLATFNGVTQPTVGIVDADRDAFLVLDFSADDVSRIRTDAPLTVTTSSGAITIAPATNTIFSGTAILATNAAGPAIQNETAEWDNPTLVPNRADPDTGIGWSSTNNMTLAAGGTGWVYVNGATGSLGFGIAASASYKYRFGGAWTPTSDPRGFFVSVATTAPAGTSAMRSVLLSGSNTTQGESQTIGNINTVEIEEPDITVGTGDTVTNAASLKIGAAPTEATNNYAVWSDAGLNRFDGDGTNVFELPADATDPTSGGGAATGRIPVKIGGSTLYIAYY
jgi:hypothetical protein